MCTCFSLVFLCVSCSEGPLFVPASSLRHLKVDAGERDGRQTECCPCVEDALTVADAEGCSQRGAYGRGLVPSGGH